MSNFLSIICAMADNRVIGKGNQLPWHLPADMRHFKSLTTGHAVLMGRKTYQSIGKPLPNRTNLIMTRDPAFRAPGCVIVASVEEALKSLRASDEAFIIGGEEIYRQFLPHASRIYLTVVHHAFEGDARFPEIDLSNWKEVSRENHPKDQDNGFDFSFITFIRSNS